MSFWPALVSYFETSIAMAYVFKSLDLIQWYMQYFIVFLFSVDLICFQGSIQSKTQSHVYGNSYG